jgi:hypothetical protein
MPVPTLRIAGVQKGDGRQTLATGEQAVIAAGTGQGLAVGQRFVARRSMEGAYAMQKLREEGWGSLRPAGILTVTAVDERFALARVDLECDPVTVGDVLEPLVVPTLPAAAPEGGPANFDDRARVLFGRDRREMFGDGDLLSIDRGASHGVAPGARFMIYRDRQNGLPLVEIGEVVVVDPGPETSRAVVVKVLDFVLSGDVAVMRGAPSQP